MNNDRINFPMGFIDRRADMPDDEQAFTSHPRRRNDASMLLKLAEGYLLDGNIDLAQSCYYQAAMSEPDNPRTCLGLGVVALTKGLLEHADVAFQMALSLDPFCSQACCALAVIRQTHADNDTTLKLFARCLVLDPRNSTALLGLLYVSIIKGSFQQTAHALAARLPALADDVDSAVAFFMPFYIRVSRLKCYDDKLMAWFEYESNFFIEHFLQSFCMKIVEHKVRCMDSLLN